MLFYKGRGSRNGYSCNDSEDLKAEGGISVPAPGISHSHGKSNMHGRENTRGCIKVIDYIKYPRKEILMCKAFRSEVLDTGKQDDGHHTDYLAGDYESLDPSETFFVKKQVKKQGPKNVKIPEHVYKDKFFPEGNDVIQF